MEKTYSEAINSAICQIMSNDSKTLVIGQLVDTPSGIFGTTTGLVQKFGNDRVKDFPISENFMTLYALGLSVGGYKTIVCHQRVDFMLYSLDAIVNWISLWYFKSNKKSNIPLVIRAVVGKGWGQGPQHSKSLHSWFASLPGLNVAIPSSPFDVKGLLIEAMSNFTPTVIIENRALYQMSSEVPDEMYQIKFGRAKVLKEGEDITLVALGVAVPQALKAAHELEFLGTSVEVIDPRTISPLDLTTIEQSCHKTKRLLVADPDWPNFGFASEVVSKMSLKYSNSLKITDFITYPFSHTPMSANLEKEFYFDAENIKEKIQKMIN